MKQGGKGGAVASKSGSDFEEKTYKVLVSDLNKIGFEVESIDVEKGVTRRLILIDKNSKQIEIYFKSAIHKYFFEPRKIKTYEYFSARLEPDTAIYSDSIKTLTIIEKKQQKGPGSVSEKLQTCDYKMLYYKTLCSPIGVEVDLIWQLGEHFNLKQESLRSVFEYLVSKGSTYYFDKVPVNKLRI